MRRLTARLGRVAAWAIVLPLRPLVLARRAADADARATRYLSVALAGRQAGRERVAMRISITVPWGERLGGAEAMLQGILDGAGEAATSSSSCSSRTGRGRRSCAAPGFRVEVIRRRAACARLIAGSRPSVAPRAR